MMHIDDLNQFKPNTLSKSVLSIVRRFQILIISGVILIHRWSTLTQPLVERHDFRQTQTAFTTLTFVNGDGGLLSSKLPLFGSPWELPFEFPLFQFVASLFYRVLNLEIDFANRFTSLIFFCLCLFPLHSIAARYMSKFAALFACLLFAFSPFAIQWSRASLIEYFVLFFGLNFVLFTLKYWQEQNSLYAIFAASAGIVCGLVKVTTLIPMLIFLFIILLSRRDFVLEFRRNWKKILVVGSIAFLALAFAEAWALFSDHIRASNPATVWMTQSRLNTWTFGTFSQRSRLENWTSIFDRIDQLIIPRFSLAAIGGVGLLFTTCRKFVIATLGSSVFTIAIFFNLYVVHDYYLVAVSPLIVMAFGAVFDCAFTTIVNRKKQIVSFMLFAILSLTWTIAYGRSYWSTAFIKYERKESELKTISRPDQYAFVSWGGWNPLILYYANRRGMMLDYRSTTLEYLSHLKDLAQYDFYAGNPDRPDVIQMRGYYSPVGAFTTRIDDQISAFNKIGLVFSRDEIRSKTTKNHVVTLNCDGTSVLDLRTIAIGTVISTKKHGDAKDFGVSLNLQSVPIGQSIVVLSDLPESNTGRLVCGGGGQVTLSW